MNKKFNRVSPENWSLCLQLKIIGAGMKMGSGGTYHSIEDHVDSMRGNVRAVFPEEADDFLSTCRPGEST